MTLTRALPFEKALRPSISRLYSTCAKLASPASHTQQNETLFQVSEIFRSVQGEGPHAGRPSVFLRLGICNLSCVWCDTPYTWLFTDERRGKVLSRVPGPPNAWDGTVPAVFKKEEQLKKVNALVLREEILRLAGQGTRALVITGGEPLLHKKPLLDVVPQFIEDGFRIEFETNGTISPAGLPRGVHLNVSPKLSNSLQPKSSRIRYEVLEECLSFPSSVLKFVVNDEVDIEELLNIVDTLRLDASRVFLMAQGTDSKSIRRKGLWLADICQQYGFYYSHRIHIELWGDKRGV